MVSEPEKELRFTRMAQARLFAIIGCLFLAISLTFLATWSTKWLYGAEPPVGPIWTIASILPAIPCFWLARHCAKHAFLILSPVGIEIFPFFKPASNFQLVHWSTIHQAEIKDEKLLLHQNSSQTSGVIVSLSPLTMQAKELLKRAIEGRMEERRS